MQNYRLSNGVEIPKIGFGTYKAAVDGTKVIEKALEKGYRHLDTASFYENESEIAAAVKAGGIRREELFLTSKVWKDDMGYDSTFQSFEATLKRLGTEYLDLFLIHWPRPAADEYGYLKEAENERPGEKWEDLDRETWKAMEELYRAKKVRAIGVSNFLPHHLLNLMETAQIPPMVNQIEFHPGYVQWATVEYCRKNQILVEAWSPISRGRMLDEPLLDELAAKYQRSAAQICIRFALQCGLLPLPKSSSPERMASNLNVFDFEISESDQYRLLTLPQLGWSGEHPDRKRIP